MPSGKALAECTHWAAALGCSAATGELPAVGLRLLNDLAHLLYCSGPAALQVRVCPHLNFSSTERHAHETPTGAACDNTMPRTDSQVCVYSGVRRPSTRPWVTLAFALSSATMCSSRLPIRWEPSWLLCSPAGQPLRHLWTHLPVAMLHSREFQEQCQSQWGWGVQVC